MSHRRSTLPVVALALLALVLSAVPRTAQPGFGNGARDCCCAVESLPAACGGCCEGGSEPAPGTPCLCEHDGPGLPPMVPAPAQESVSAVVERCVLTPTLPARLGSVWCVPVIGAWDTGPPIHVRNCVWLI